jgi:signal transduction histidine kinase/CheY-like chemotaxis protein
LNESKPPLQQLSWLVLAIAGAAGLALLLDPDRLSGAWKIGATVFALLAAILSGVLAALSRRQQAALIDMEEAARQRQQERDELKRELERHSQLEQQLRQAKQDAESAVLAKGEFLATMSHEIRTPLNGIVPMLDLLMHNRLPPDQAELVHTAFLSSQQMLRIVDDILDYSKLEASKLQLETTTFNLRETLETLIQLMDRPAQSKGLRLSLHIDPTVRLPVRGDPVRLRQVISNLLSNAVKFTERGSVSLSVRRLGETSSQHQLRFEVRDTGIGISQAAQSRLFQAFSQADASTTRLYGGTGLGLAISKRIIDLMGGKIGVESTSGQGANFWFEIPLLKVQGDIAVPRTVESRGGRVLLLTGDQRLRLRLSMVLPNWGLRMTTAETTQEALEKIRHGASQGGPAAFSAVIADLAGVRSTAVALQRNLERHATYGQVRLICLRGDEPAPEELQQHALVLPRLVPDADLRVALLGNDTGQSDTPQTVSTLMTTPSDYTPPASEEPVEIVPPKLMTNADDPSAFGMTASALAGYAAVGMPPPPPSPAPPASTPAAPAPAPQPMYAEAPSAAAAAPAPAAASESDADATRRMRVLLVEDNPVNLMVGQRLLSVLGTHCDSATNGEAALLRMQASRYDLVLMDCQMPVMDGYTATRKWREHEAATGASRRLPIVAMTANAMAGDRQKCLDAGMDDYLAKPVTRAELERCLFHWQQASTDAQNPMAAAAAAAAALPDVGVVAPPPPPSEPAAPVLDLGVLDELRSMLGNEVDRLIEVFLDDSPRLIAALEMGAAASDYEMLRNAAHTLKSSSANLGAVSLSAAAKKVETGARNKSLERPAVAVALISHEFDRTRQALRAQMGQSV